MAPKKQQEEVKSIESIIASIQKQTGKDAIDLMDKYDGEIRRIPSGSLKLDLALGGGWPRGRIVEVFGNQSSGKSTLAILAIREAQKADPDPEIKQVYVDLERTVSKELMACYGVDVSRVIYYLPDSGEEMFDYINDFIQTGKINLIVIDSVTAIEPGPEFEASVAQNTIGLQARLMSKALKKVARLAKKFDVLMFFCNQIREKVGVMYGNPETTSGGRALQFYASICCKTTMSDKYERDGVVVGNKIIARMTKNKTAMPFRVAEFDLYYKQGIDMVEEIASMAIEAGLIEKSGAWYYVYREDDEVRTKQTARLAANGKAAVVQCLYEDVDLYEELKGKIMAA